MWCNIFLLFIFGNIILQTNAVNMCTNHTTAARDLTLNLIKGSGSSDCYCSIIFKEVATLPDNIQSKITFKAEHFSGCKYKLVISYNNTHQRFSCNNNNTIFHNINKTDEIKLYLELNSSSNDDTGFGVKITSGVNTGQGPMIRLECLSSNTTDTTAIPSTKRTNTMISSTSTTMKSTENIETSDMPNSSTASSNESTTSSNESTTISTNTPITYTKITSISIFESTTRQPTTSDSTNTNTKMDAGGSDTELDIGLIGGVVGGILILIVVIIVIIVCIVRRKKTSDKNYNKPTSRVSENGYTDIILQGNDTNSSKDGVKNDQGDPVSTQQSAICEKAGPIQMEIIDNELYVSSDDLDDLKSHNDNICNQNSATPNSQNDMEIIENELYVSSDDVLNASSNNDNAPIYAVVNKKPKSQLSDSNETSDGISKNDHVTSL